MDKDLPKYEIKYLNHTEVMTLDWAKSILKDWINQYTPLKRETVLKNEQQLLFMAAKERIDTLMNLYFDTPIMLYRNGKYRYTARKRYRDDDPCWNAEPTNEQCVDIISSIMAQAISDANGGTVGFHSEELRGPRRKVYMSEARHYIEHGDFRHHCNLLGIEPDVAIQNAIKPENLGLLEAA